jgi:protein SCO1/2
MERVFLAPLLVLICLFCPVQAQDSSVPDNDKQYDADAALAISQAAVGTQLENLALTSRDGRTVRLAELRGKPLIISMIFTSCYHVCPAITRHIATAVENAREVLGQDSFAVATIGFDTANDSPEAMRAFARAQSIEEPEWYFLSTDADTMQLLVENIGFVYFPSPRGFDHINQVTVVDQEGIIYQQVYGAAFELPWLVEPLKDLVFGRPRSAGHFVAGLADRIRLFCTVYDPTTGRYRFDYSLFVQIAVGASVVLGVIAWLLVEARRRRKAGSG